MSSLCAGAALLLAALAAPAQAHEVRPAIADLSVEATTLTLQIDLNLEAIVAGIDLAGLSDTNASDRSGIYDQMRALDPDALEQAFAAEWPRMQAGITLRVDGQDIAPRYDALLVDQVGNVELPRLSSLTLRADIPADARDVVVGWDAAFGPLVLRQMPASDTAYTGYLTDGALSPPIAIAGGSALTGWQAFAQYVVIGFEHILPKGLDHILFVLGLFLLSLHLRPLLWQVTAFTLAHTITLALAVLGIVSVPATVVEPLIAASIVFVAVENILSPQMRPWRPFVVFGFGLLHGLGFASVLGDVGLEPGRLITGLIGFNVGVELGQLTVIALAFLAVGLWFRNKPWYRSRITNPASAVIALIGFWWVIQRTLL